MAIFYDEYLSEGADKANWDKKNYRKNATINYQIAQSEKDKNPLGMNAVYANRQAIKSASDASKVDFKNNISNKDAQKFKHAITKFNSKEADPHYAEIKHNIRTDANNVNKDKLADKQSGSILAKQEEKRKALKEACEYILSILNEEE